MLKAGLKPLEPYTQFHAKWKCLHIACGEIVYPSYAVIQGGQGGCRDCGNKIGGDYNERISDFQQLSSGIYSIVVKTDKKVYTNKVVKE